MNTRTKHRIILAAVLISAAIIACIALWKLDDRAESLDVASVASGAYEGKKVQVSGAVVDNSLTTADGVAHFMITGEYGSSDRLTQLEVIYGGAMPATFGNGVVALCTGRMEQGKLVCSQLITKCPSKYESAQGALSVAELLGASDARGQGEVKLAGTVVPHTLSTKQTVSGTQVQFMLTSGGAQIPVVFDGEVSKEVADDTALVLRGRLREDTTFEVSDLAIDADTSRQKAPQAQEAGR